jgi:extradiol dioxygenase family protein
MTISVENSNDIDRLEKRLEQNGISFTKKDQTIIVSDPWNNVLEFGIIN